VSTLLLLLTIERGIRPERESDYFLPPSVTCMEELQRFEVLRRLSRSDRHKAGLADGVDRVLWIDAMGKGIVGVWHMRTPGKQRYPGRVYAQMSAWSRHVIKM
jgi:hypothetical protein